jgi:hypothetical protein
MKFIGVSPCKIDANFWKSIEIPAYTFQDECKSMHLIVAI